MYLSLRKACLEIKYFYSKTYTARYKFIQNIQESNVSPVFKNGLVYHPWVYIITFKENLEN